MATTTTNVNQMASQFRMEVVRNETRARAAMASAWREVRVDIGAEIDGLVRTIEARGVRSANELYRLERWVAFQDYATSRLTAYADGSHARTTRLVEWAAHFGGESAASLLDDVAAMVGLGMTMPSEHAVTAMVGRVRWGGAARAFKTIPSSGVAATERILISGIAVGQNPRVMASRMRQAMDVSVYNAQRIARTETMTAYRAAHTETYAANKRLLEGWRWDAALDERTCDLCWTMDGEVFEPDYPFETHVNCRCWQTPIPLGHEDVLRRGWREDGETRFARLPEEEQVRILGPGRQELYREGVPLKAMQRVTHDPYWGASRQRIPLRELRPLPMRA